jgi:hypothetical protein
VEKETKKKKRKKERERTATEYGTRVRKGTDNYGSFGILLEYGDSERSKL